jgi:hypothetical protein
MAPLAQLSVTAGETRAVPTKTMARVFVVPKSGQHTSEMDPKVEQPLEGWHFLSCIIAKVCFVKGARGELKQVSKDFLSPRRHIDLLFFHGTCA